LKYLKYIFNKVIREKINDIGEKIYNIKMETDIEFND
jgi:hypothetical protein